MAMYIIFNRLLNVSLWLLFFSFLILMRSVNHGQSIHWMQMTGNVLFITALSGILVAAMIAGIDMFRILKTKGECRCIRIKPSGL
jgi:hypothetical protein